MGALIASLLTLLLSVAITSPMLVAPGAAVMVAAPADRPNIIFILTDDLDAKSIAVMPKLKSLMIDRGVTFANYFVSTSTAIRTEQRRRPAMPMRLPG